MKTHTNRIRIWNFILLLFIRNQHHHNNLWLSPGMDQRQTEGEKRCLKPKNKCVCVFWLQYHQTRLKHSWLCSDASRSLPVLKIYIEKLMLISSAAKYISRFKVEANLMHSELKVQRFRLWFAPPPAVVHLPVWDLHLQLKCERQSNFCADHWPSVLKV